MDSERIIQIKEKFQSVWNGYFSKPDEEGLPEAGREKFIVFLVAFILALCLWLMVNLSRDYNLNINLPITLGNVPPDQALAEELPNFATVGITGEGWKLINIYNNPPQIYVDVTQQEVSLYDQVRQQINAVPDLNVLKVQPLFLSLELEEKVSKKVPVRPNIEVSFKELYGFVDEPRLVPDSVTVTGASSLVEEIDYWETDSVEVTDVKDRISVSVPLKQPNPLLELSTDEVNYQAAVSQYTEGEARVYIMSRNMPEGRIVSFSPSSITVRYNVPIDEYAGVQNLSNPFTAYVSYDQIRRDSTGFVTPRIEKTASSDYHYEIRSFHPREVAYFMVIGN